MGQDRRPPGTSTTEPEAPPLLTFEATYDHAPWVWARLRHFGVPDRVCPEGSR